MPAPTAPTNSPALPAGKKKVSAMHLSWDSAPNPAKGSQTLWNPICIMSHMGHTKLQAGAQRDNISLAGV